MARKVLLPILAALLIAGAGGLPLEAPARAQVRRAANAPDITAEEVLRAIDRAVRFLKDGQRGDGSWEDFAQYEGGTTALVLLALLSAEVPTDDPVIQRGLRYLRDLEPEWTYVTSLQTMALAAAGDPADQFLISRNARWLEQMQVPGSGMWSYGSAAVPQVLARGDNSNTQFALLALHEARRAGVEISQEVWESARNHFLASQDRSGGWGYQPGDPRVTGSMTVAGIASLIIAGSEIHPGQERIEDGRILRCGDYEQDDSLEDALQWLGRNFSVQRNPGGGLDVGGTSWLLYYLYGLERAGRLSARRYFGEHDWYREGARLLVDMQDPVTGRWRGIGHGENQAYVATSFALLFLSKGLSPVLINKLQHGPGDDWNNDRNDVRNLTEHISDQWGRLLTWQIVRSDGASPEDFAQAPVVFMNGHLAPQLDDDEVAALRGYITEHNGFLFAEACCGRTEFDEGFRDLMERMFPEHEYRLRELPPDHPVWRSEYLIDPEGAPRLWGIEYGCRTCVIYSPEDLSCYWEQLSNSEAIEDAAAAAAIDKARRLGVNVIAYATGREPPNRLEIDRERLDGPPEQRIRRGLLQIAQLRHAGEWDVAHHALTNLLAALDREVQQLNVLTERRVIDADAPDIVQYPVLYMHGRTAFAFSDSERERLREHLELGGVLIADACCSSETFHQSFVEEIERMFPDHPLERIPFEHEMFQGESYGFNIETVRRRELDRAGDNQALRMVERPGPPVLYGIEIDGRYAVLYSPYDLSCALEGHASLGCAGYVQEDAVRIGVNLVLYALLQ